MRNRIFSTDSPKAIKADKYGYINAIHYMAPADTGGVGNLCPFLSTGCKDLCLGKSLISGYPYGYVIGLSPKGSKAKHDTSGFVVR